MDKIEGSRAYHQAYYAWSDTGKNKDVGIIACSCQDNEIENACRSAVTNKYAAKFKDKAITTEYFQYDINLGRYLNYGIYGLKKVHPRVQKRESRLIHIYFPTEREEQEDSSNYIRKMSYWPRVAQVHNVNLELTTEEVEPYMFDYGELLKKYHLDGERYRSRLAFLLSMEFVGFFHTFKRQIAFSLEDDLGDEQYHTTAIEMTWLLHQWVPDCLKRSKNDLRHQMGYAIADTIGDDMELIAFFFMPRTVSAEYEENRFDIAVSDIKDSEEYRNRIEKGADFFYELAGKAQISPENLWEFVRQLCSSTPEEKIETDDLLELYGNYQFLQGLEAGQLDWEVNEMDSLLKEAGAGQSNAQRKCMEYFEYLWKQKQEQVFSILTPERITLAAENLICTEKNTNEQEEDSLQDKMYDKYICYRLDGIANDNIELGLKCMRECLQFYVKIFGNEQFCTDIQNSTKELYLKCVESSPERCIEIEEEVKQHESIFAQQMSSLLTIPVCSHQFLDCYNSDGKNDIWYGRAAVYLEKLLSDSNFADLSVEQYKYFLEKYNINVDQKYYIKFKNVLNNIMECGEKFLKSKPVDLQRIEDRKKVFYWLAAKRREEGFICYQDLDNLFTFKTFAQLLDASETDKEIDKIKKKLREVDADVVYIYGIKEDFFEDKDILSIPKQKNIVKKMDFEDFAVLLREMANKVVETKDSDPNFKYRENHLKFISWFGKGHIDSWEQIYTYLQECQLYEQLASIWDSSDKNWSYAPDLNFVVTQLNKINQDKREENKPEIVDSSSEKYDMAEDTLMKNTAVPHTSMEGDYRLKFDSEEDLRQCTPEQINTKQDWEQFCEACKKFGLWNFLQTIIDCRDKLFLQDSQTAEQESMANKLYKRTEETTATKREKNLSDQLPQCMG